MECPKCHKEMTQGFIYGDRYALKWSPADKKALGGIWVTDGIKLKTNAKLLGRPKTVTFACETCDHLIIDLNTERA
ncbi:PF20097 family protein [Streptococcus zalophi]|uniref:DUF6487 domain-containing protein n=1 Tax=Streptococcus zalophi TaxID=640031 RepID=A0A934PAY3_9STRE|nr:PF20097 family protein [Streptococcus zalophi]MBJ8350304.1 hypothetical protein [Streptococcus zalophi]MCR8968267.1 PF20097 family protein [Streptococcus zalophi]